MGQVMKARLLAGIALTFCFVGMAGALARYITAFDKIQLNQNAILDSTSTQRLSIGSTNAITGNLTVSGTAAITGVTTHTGAVSISTLTITNAQGLGWDPNFITVGTDVPSSTGTVAFTSTWLMYVATGTGNAYQWYKIGAQ